jgi:hypothetical protein
VDSIVFIGGQIIDIESLAKRDSTFQIECRYVIPKYELCFELRCSSIGIKSYSVEVNLDEHGQIIRFDWPREDFNKLDSFVEPDSLRKTAMSFAIDKEYKTQSMISDLVFDQDKQRLYWCFSFLQNSSGDDYNYYKEYITLAVDALENFIVEELNTQEVSNSD